MIHSFLVFHHGLKTFERDKRLGHNETLELVFHILLEKKALNCLFDYSLRGHREYNCLIQDLETNGIS